MKKKSIWGFLLLGLIAIVGPAAQVVPTAISPGRESGVALVGETCPTFSWTAVDWAFGYRIAVFQALGVSAVSYEQMAASGTVPVLSRDIAGRGLSWTPSGEESLAPGGLYVWYVEAMNASGQGVWSAGKVFIVVEGADAGPGAERVRQILSERGIKDEVIIAVLQEMNPGTKGNNTGGSGAKTDAVRPQGVEGESNTCYGLEAGKNLNLGLYNSFFGRSAGYWNSNGDFNTLIGFEAGFNTTEGTANLFLGYQAGYANTSTDGNVFLGYRAGYRNTSGVSNVFAGYEAGYNTTTGHDNSFFGDLAGHGTTTGYHNTFLGASSGSHNTTGDYNTSLGSLAGHSNVSGNRNTALGYYAGFTNSAGQGNIFLGYSAGSNETGSNKLYIANTNTAAPLIYGEFDNAILAVNGRFGVGTQAPAYPMELKTTGRNATFVIQRTEGGALNFINATSNYGQFGTGNNYPVRIQVNNAWKMQLDNDNSLTMANGATCTAGGVWTNASSRELKANIENLTSEEATAVLAELAPVKYSYKADKAERHVGFIAEDVPDLVASKDRKTLSPMDVVAVLTKIVQEQQKTIAEQQKSISELQQRMNESNKKTSPEK